VCQKKGKAGLGYLLCLQRRNAFLWFFCEPEKYRDFSVNDDVWQEVNKKLFMPDSRFVCILPVTRTAAASGKPGVTAAAGNRP
jgi:hypothetical protein